MTKEECNEALTRLLRPYFASAKIQNAYHDINKGHSIYRDSNVLTLLIEEHFELEQNFKTLEKNYDYIYDIFHCTKAYEFEDLKGLIGKPIFDYKYKEFYILVEVKEEELYKDEGLEKIMICSDKKGLLRVFFEEGRFYPVTKALEYQGKEDKND